MSSFPVEHVAAHRGYVRTSPVSALAVQNTSGVSSATSGLAFLTTLPERDAQNLPCEMTVALPGSEIWLLRSHAPGGGGNGDGDRSGGGGGGEDGGDGGSDGGGAGGQSASSDPALVIPAT